MSPWQVAHVLSIVRTLQGDLAPAWQPAAAARSAARRRPSSRPSFLSSSHLHIACTLDVPLVSAIVMVRIQKHVYHALMTLGDAQCFLGIRANLPSIATLHINGPPSLSNLPTSPCLATDQSGKVVCLCEGPLSLLLILNEEANISRTNLVQLCCN